MSLPDEMPTVRRGPTSGTHVAITLSGTSDHTLWADVTMDVAGAGGVFIATYHALPLGTVVDLLLTFEGETLPVAARGVVRWSRPHRDGSDAHAGVGVRLVDVTEKLAGVLERFASRIREPLMFDLEDAPMRARSVPRLAVAR
jgi:uncharacterized protein (TIGR02266 family)